MSFTPDTYLVKTFFGLEPVLAKELEQLGAQNIRQVKRAVTFTGDKALLYKTNLWLRTALRILKPLAEFKVYNEEELYQKVQEIDWREYLALNGTLAVDSVVNSPHFRHSKFVALKTKDAIVDQYRQQYGRRPSVNTDKPDLRINVHIFKERCTLSVDSSGDSLHKRGYRLSKNLAPLNEVLAAGMILLSGWNGESHFVDPMCGSGTLLIEAGFIGQNLPPQIYREHFGFKKWRDYDDKLWQSILEEAQNGKQSMRKQILGSDIDGKALSASRENITRAQMGNIISLRRKAFDQTKPPAAPGMLIMNPPYGERMQEEDIQGFYAEIGDVLKQRYPGYHAWIISSNVAALKKVGLRAKPRYTLFNGPLECRYHHYEMFKGKAKD